MGNNESMALTAEAMTYTTNNEDYIFEDFTNRLMVLNPNALKPEYREQKYLYFIAEGGFGCEPAKLGTKVYGEFAEDGEICAWRRGDFIGFADLTQVPPNILARYLAVKAKNQSN